MDVTRKENYIIIFRQFHGEIPLFSYFDKSNEKVSVISIFSKFKTDLTIATLTFHPLLKALPFQASNLVSPSFSLN